jgi:RNA polymerase sigma-70 factor (ECF subfamily)
MDARPAQPGEPPAWDWEQARRVCLSEAQRVIGRRDQAEDAAQEALVRAWRQRTTCLDPHNPGPWLRRIASREALRLVARAPAPAQEVVDDVDAGFASEWVQTASIRHLLAQLHPTDRTLIFLQYWADIPVSDIAARLRMPEGTVKIRLLRARASLRAMLDDEHD